MYSLKFNYVECSCGTPDHLLRFCYDEDDKVMYVYTQMGKRNIFGRIITAIKYIFNGECKYGHWEETVLDLEQMGELHDLLHKAMQIKIKT